MSTARQPIAYLVNQYPKVSHTFIRREIHALERLGLTVDRYAIRGWDAAPADPEDVDEQRRTRYLLAEGTGALLAPTLRALLRMPLRFLETLRLAWRMGRRADRPLLYHFVYFAQACRLVEWLRTSRAAHLHAHFGTNPAEVAMLVHALGGPGYSFTVHGPEEFDKPEFLGLTEKMRHAAFVVAVSSYGRSQLYRWAEAATWPKIEVIHCGLEPAFHENRRSAAPADRRLVCVGRLCEQKGQLLLIEAAHRLAAKGRPVELVLAGDGEMRPEVEAAIERHGLRDHVRITGWIGSAQVRDEMLAARALVLPSFAEGLPVVIMEAMALGRPVISTFVAGIPELVRDGDEGWLVPAGDVEALAAAIERSLETAAAELAQIGERARQRVLARHDVDVEAGKLAALFERSVRPLSATRAPS